jgi:outer membrane protein assembly factor BamB
MNTRIPAKVFRYIQSYLPLILLLLPLLSACGSSSTSIFEQSPVSSDGNGTNQSPDSQNLSQLHPLWTYTFDPARPYKMIMADGITYTAAFDHTYTLIAIKRGKQLWRYQTATGNDYISSMQIGIGNVYIVTRKIDSAPSNDTISAFNAYTGRERWHYSPHDEVSQLIYAQGLLYFSTPHEVYTLDAHTGKLQWRYQLGDGSNYSLFRPFLAATRANLYISLATSPYQAGTNLIALDGRTGKVQWQHSVKGDMESSIVVANGVIYRCVYLGSQANRLSAFNAQTGQTMWETTVSASCADEKVDMKVVGRLLYLCEVGEILAFALNTGHIVWNAKLEGSISIGPVIGSGVVYVGTEIRAVERFLSSSQTREWLYALDAQSGKIIRTLQDADSSFKTESLAMDNNHLYVLGSREFIGSDEAARGKPQLYALGI